MNENDLITFFENNSDIMQMNSVWLDNFRTAGWIIIRGFKWLADLSQQLFNMSFNLLNFTDYPKVDAFIRSFKPIFAAIFILSLVVYGMILIINHKEKPKVLTAIILAAMIISGSSYVIQTLNTAIVYGKNAILAGDANMPSSTDIVRSNFYDLIYIDNSLPGGLKDMTFDNYADTSYDSYLYPSLTNQQIKSIYFNATINPDNPYIKTSEAKEIFSKKMVQYYNSNKIEDLNNGLALFNNFGNEWYYRYKIKWFPTIISMVSLIIVYILMSYRVAHTIFYIVVNRLLALLYSANMNGSKKTIKILEGIKDGYIILLLCCALIKLYLLFQEYINSMANLNAGVRSIFLLFGAIIIIEGPYLVQQLTGMDVGLSNGIQRMMSLGRFAMGMTRGAINTYDRHERRSWQRGQAQRFANNNKSGSNTVRNGNLEQDHSDPNPAPNSAQGRENSGTFASGTGPVDKHTNTNFDGKSSSDAKSAHASSEERQQQSKKMEHATSKPNSGNKGMSTGSQKPSNNSHFDNQNSGLQQSKEMERFTSQSGMNGKDISAGGQSSVNNNRQNTSADRDRFSDQNSNLEQSREMEKFVSKPDTGSKDISGNKQGSAQSSHPNTAADKDRFGDRNSALQQSQKMENATSKPDYGNKGISADCKGTSKNSHQPTADDNQFKNPGSNLQSKKMETATSGTVPNKNTGIGSTSSDQKKPAIETSGKGQNLQGRKDSSNNNMQPDHAHHAQPGNISNTSKTSVHTLSQNEHISNRSENVHLQSGNSTNSKKDRPMKKKNSPEE